MFGTMKKNKENDLPPKSKENIFLNSLSPSHLNRVENTFKKNNF